MKKTISVLALAGLAALAWAQETQTPPDVGVLAAQVKSLASKVSLGGYLLGGMTFNLSDSNAFPTDSLLDVSEKGYKGDRFRMNLTYTDDWGGFRTRIEYNPFAGKQTNVAAGYYPTASQNELVKVYYAEPYLWVVPKVVKVGTGMVDNESDFAMVFAVSNWTEPTFFTGIDNASGTKTVVGAGLNGVLGSNLYSTLDPNGGAYYGAWGGELLVYVPGVDGLELGIFAPLYGTNGAGTDAAGLSNPGEIQGAVDLVDGVYKAMDYNAAYKIKDVGTVKAGWNGRRTTNTVYGSGLGNATSVDVGTAVYGLNVFYGTFEFRPSFLPQLYSAVGYEGHTTQDGKTEANDLYLTGGYDFRDLGVKDFWIGEDFAIGQVDESKAGGYTNAGTATPVISGYTTNGNYLGLGYFPTETNVTQFSTNTKLKYTFTGVLPNGLKLVPNINFNTYWEFAQGSTTLGSAVIQAVGYVPKLDIIAPNGDLLGIGYGLYTGTKIHGGAYSLLGVTALINY